MASTKILRKPVPRAGSSPSEGKPRPDLSGDVESLTLDTSRPEDDEPAPSQFIGGSEFLVQSPTAQSLQSGDEPLESPSPATPGSEQQSKQSVFKTAYQDARHFAGGLVSHPYESSNHFAVMRHSHGLVYFKGFHTNVAVTVFGDRDLPADRQYWLQKRGYSGKTGLRIGASILGTKGAWINVTPATTATADRLPPSDERAWQRDISKFLRKAPNKSKNLKNFRPLETCIIRVPCSAEDGYFRVVLCAGDSGKKTLCPSPVFRLISTSADMGSVRGASLSTLPLELGMKIGQFAARQAAVNAATPVASTATEQVQSMIPWQTGGITQAAAQQAATTAYGVTAAATVDAASAQADENRQRNVDQFVSQLQDELDHASAIGEDSGPSQPYPLRFAAKVKKGSGRSRQDLGMPTANLADIPNDVLLRLSGTYCGWVTFASSKGIDLPSELSDDWHQAVITVVPRPESKASVVLKKDVHVYLIRDFEGKDFVDAKLSLMVMGLLRSRGHVELAETKDTQVRMVTAYRDIAATQASLCRPAWGADQTLTRIKSDRSNRSFGDKLSGVQQGVAKQTDKVPLHWAGVRSESLTLRDQLVGNGGVAVKR